MWCGSSKTGICLHHKPTVKFTIVHWYIQVLNIDTLNISDDDKMVTITEILHIICGKYISFTVSSPECYVETESIQSGQNVTELVSHGIDLLTVLLPENTPPEDTRYHETFKVLSIRTSK